MDFSPLNGEAMNREIIPCHIFLSVVVCHCKCKLSSDKIAPVDFIKQTAPTDPNFHRAISLVFTCSIVIALTV